MSRRQARAWNVYVGCLLLAGCSEDASAPRSSDKIPEHGPWEHGFETSATEQELGNAEVGRDLVLNGGYMGCGIPARLMDTPLLATAITSVLGSQGTGQKIDGRNEKNAKLDHTMNVFESLDGVDVVNVGCLMCHAGSFNGELIIGLGSADADFTDGFGSGGLPTLGVGVPSSLTALLSLNEIETDNLNKMLVRSAAFTDITAMRTVGQNPAEAMAIALMAHHEPDLTWSDEPVVAWEFRGTDGKIDDPVPFPSDVPPWWRAKKKGGLFYNAMARGDHSGSMALATSICIDTTEQAEIVAAMFRDMHAYVLTLEAPKYPFEIDSTLAKEGKRLFLDNCAGCHGTYGESDEQDTFPNLLLPLEVIGTDPTLAQGGVLHAPQMVENYNKTY